MMADYYVSKDGDDSTGDGLSWATAWKTPAHADANSAAASHIHVAAGAYLTESVADGIKKHWTGYGKVIFDGNGGTACLTHTNGTNYTNFWCTNITFRNATYADTPRSDVYYGLNFESCVFEACYPKLNVRYYRRMHNCIFVDCGVISSYKDSNTLISIRGCTLIGTALSDGRQVERIQQCVFVPNGLSADYHQGAELGPHICDYNCYDSVDAINGIDGQTSLAAWQSASGQDTHSFTLADPLQDPTNGIYHPKANQLLYSGYAGRLIGALPYAHVLSPNVNSAAFAAPDHTDNVEQDGDVWKLTSPGAGVLSWYRDLGNAYNVTGIDVIGSINDSGDVWDTDNSDGDLTYLIKGSASAFTPVTSTPTAGVDGWQLANHGESIALTGVRYVQVWIVPRTNGVT